MNWSLSKSAAVVGVLALYLDTNWLLTAGKNLCLFYYKGNCHNIRENTQVDPVKWQQTVEKRQTAIFICVVYPRDSLYQTLLVLERFKIVLLPFSNPQFICMPAVCILLEIHVSYDSSKLLWKYITNSVATILKVKTSMRGWRAGDRIYFDGLHYCTADASSLFKCNSRDSTVATSKRKKCQPVWSTSTSNVASDLTARSVHSVWLTWEQVTVEFPCEVQTLPGFGCKLTSSAEFFGTVLSSLRMRPADNPRKYVIYFNSLYKSTFLAE